MLCTNINNMNKMKLLIWSWSIATAILMATSCSCFAQECPDLEIFITKTAPELKTWQDIYRIVKSYPGCDDGAYAEAYSEFVVHSLARHWERLGELIILTSADSNFHDFILKHIDATTDPDDIASILINAQKRCQTDNEQFCKEIQWAALEANEDFKESGITTPSTQTRD
jgi:hypothetical protein